ncbi:MAG: hypothetical protein LBN37_02530 [Bacteroidales bacterium]|jgi:hypothetical protein|nr:hypothetical protein [Bacteroidales bacterium]
MLGFEVHVKDKVIYASVGNDDVLCVIASYCNDAGIVHNNSKELHVSGMEAGKHQRWWYMDNIDDVEQMTIKVVDVEQNSELISSFHFNKEKELLKDYHRLKKELEEEGLL